jgi:hypothetical protein
MNGMTAIQAAGAFYVGCTLMGFVMDRDWPFALSFPLLMMGVAVAGLSLIEFLKAVPI